MKKITFSSHVALINGKEYDGIGNALLEVLPDITDSFIFVKHSMDGKMPSFVINYDKIGEASRRKIPVISRIGPLRYLTEVLSTIYYFCVKEKTDIYIGIDPLNALAGIILRKIGKVSKAVFYTADYSTKRFDNKILNQIYHKIDAYCVKNADEVWSVSSRIVDVRRKMGLDDEKNIFLPNVPPTKFDVYRSLEHNKHTLVTSGIIDKQLDFENTFKAIAELKEEYPDIRLQIFGNGPEEGKLKTLAEELRISDRINFMGKKPLGEMLEYVAKAGVGLALYTGVWGFNEYGDSTKCREYFNFGLPVITTDTHSTVSDLKSFHAGIVAEMDVNAYAEAISNILLAYDDYSKASAQLGSWYSGAHKRTLNRLLST